MARDRYNTDSIRHDDVLSLTQDAKTGLLQCSDRIQMIDAWYLWHGYTRT